MRRVLRFLWLSFRGLLAVGAIFETAQGAPSAVDWLADAGVTQPHTLGLILAAVITIIAVLVALGPERVKRWLALAHRQEPASPSLYGEVASRPRLIFAGTVSAPASVVHGPLPSITFFTDAAGGADTAPPPTVTASAAVADPRGSGTMGATDPTGAAVLRPSQNEYVRVRVKNEPESGFGAAAEDVHARIEFLDSDGTLILEMAGSWAEAKQRLETGRIGITHEPEELTIPANGLCHELDIALKSPGDKHSYACNYDNTNATAHRLEEHRLSVSECRVRVQLRASNMPPVEGMFDLRDDGEHLTLTECTG